MGIKKLCKRNCDKCEKSFRPKGRNQKLCENCFIERKSIRNKLSEEELKEEIRFSNRL